MHIMEWYTNCRRWCIKENCAKYDAHMIMHMIWEIGFKKFI